MSSPKRRTYDSEFKQNAVLLTEDPSRTVTEVAESLGVAKDLLYRWRREFAAQGKVAFQAEGIRPSQMNSAVFGNWKRSLKMQNWSGIF